MRTIVGTLLLLLNAVFLFANIFQAFTAATGMIGAIYMFCAVLNLVSVIILVPVLAEELR